jgi:hypothetical protein
MRIRTLFLYLCLIGGLAFDALCATLIFVPLTRDFIKYYHNPWTATLMGAGMFLGAFAFAYGCVQAWVMLRTIDKGQAFTQRAVDLLRRLKWSVGFVAIGVAVCWPQYFVMAAMDDIPPLFYLMIMLMMALLVIAVFLAILQRLWQAALDYKQDSDLTV